MKKFQIAQQMPLSFVFINVSRVYRNDSVIIWGSIPY